MINFVNRMRNLHWKNMRLIHKLLLIYVPIIILPAILCMLLILQSYNIFSKQLLGKYSTDILNIGVSKIETQVKNYEQLSERFITDEQIQALLKTTPESQYDEVEMINGLNSRINSLLLENSDYSYIKSIIINKHGKLYFFGSERDVDFGVTDPALEKQVSDLKGGTIWYLPQKYISSRQNDSGNSEYKAFRLCRAILDKNLKEIAQVTIVIDTRCIENIFNNLKLKDYIALQLTSGNGFVIYENNQNLREPNNQHGKIQKYTVESPYNGWILIAVYPERLLYQPLYNISNRSVLLIMIFIFFGVIGTYILNSDIIIPLRKLVLNIKNTLKNQPGQRFIIFNGAKEIVEINSTYIAMVKEMDRLNHELMESEKMKHEAKIRILQSQLSPHFLYNALNTIRWMAMIKKQNNIKDYVDSLVNLLTYSLRNTNDMVELKYEIEILNDYVKIQKVRYHNFSFETRIEEQLQNIKILKLLIQPIIENAMIHGLFNKTDSGIIRLTIELASGKVHIIVEDNGIGIDADKLEAVNALLHEDQDQHVGLKNIHERIRLNFGDEFGLFLESEKDVGTKVHVFVPYIPEK